jgi:hypothetical protein
MSGISLSSPVPHAADTSCDIQIVNVNYDTRSVLVRVEYSPSGQTKDYRFSAADGSLQALIAAVNQFAGLRLALLQYLQTLDSSLGGAAT